MRVSDSLYIKSLNGSSLTIDGSSVYNILVVNDNGNVGIGTASPTTLLHVYATQSGAFRLQDTTQGSGKILVSDSNGVASWTSSILPSPIVRDIYLVGDVSDATSMGGSSKNTYTTFQSAYNAANTLQISLGANSVVNINVGTTINTRSNFNSMINLVGDLTLTSDFNIRIALKGKSALTSILGNITLSSATGSAFNIGSGNLYLKMSSLTVGDINTSATGVTGNSGRVTISPESVSIGNIITSVTNASNTSGLGGLVSILTPGTVTTSSFICSSINTSVIGATAAAGAVNITCDTFRVPGAITTSNNNIGGGISLSPALSGYVGSLIFLTDGTSGTAFTSTRTTFNGINLKSRSASFIDCILGGLTTITSQTIQSSIRISNSRISHLVFNGVVGTPNPQGVTVENCLSLAGSAILPILIDFINFESNGLLLSNTYKVRITNTESTLTATGTSNVIVYSYFNSINSISGPIIVVSDGEPENIFNYITYANASELVTNNNLIQGNKYILSDVGDRGVTLTAISKNKFSPEGVRLMLVPNIGLSSSQALGVQYTTIASWITIKMDRIYSGPLGYQGFLAIWGGKVWYNTGIPTTDIGITTSNTTLSSPWSLISKSNFSSNEYITKQFKVKYDFKSNEIYYQEDEFGNKVGGYVGITNALGYNPCDVTDWSSFLSNGYADGNYYYAVQYTCYNNTVINGIFNNGVYATNVPIGINIYNNILDDISNNSFNLNYNVVYPSFNYSSNSINLYNNINGRVTNNQFGSSINNNRDTTITNNDTFSSILSNSNCNFNNNSYVSNINNCKYLTINSNIYSTFSAATISNIKSDSTISIVSGDTTIYRDIEVIGNTLRGYLNFTGTKPIGSQYLSGVIVDNFRLTSAKVIGYGLTATSNFTYGIENSNPTYLGTSSGYTLMTIPQNLNTISNVSTHGQRFILTTSTASTTSPTSSIVVWYEGIF